MVMRKLIHCEEIQKADFDKRYGSAEGTKKCREMIGFIFPDNPDKDTWDVTMAEEGTFYTATGQDHAEIIANQEMIKALLLRK